MKKYLLWIGIAAVALYFWMKRGTTANSGAGNKAATKNAGTTTATATNADPFWGGWGNATDTILQNTTAKVKSATASTNSLYSGISGLFGGVTSSLASGKTTPTTSGSGAGIPVNADGSNSDTDPLAGNSSAYNVFNSSGSGQGGVYDFGSSSGNSDPTTYDPNADMWSQD